MRESLVLSLFLCGVVSAMAATAPTPPKLARKSASPESAVVSPSDWHGRIPTGGEDPQLWIALTQELVDHQLYFGAVAAAERMLLYFPDPATREVAYRAITSSVRGGYPLLVHELFREGELEPEGHDSFTDAYFTYKGIINEKSGISRWSEALFRRVDPVKVPEYVFYQGVKAYQAKKLDDAIVKFSSLLDLNVPEVVNRSFSIRVARTVARIHFEKEEYEKSLAIYDKFLLKLNPMFPGDWLEAAWDLFYLKRYSQALGYLYNLESASSDSVLLFEKYVLRGLIYKQLCAERELDNLGYQFERLFGGAITGMELGQPLENFRFLRRIKSSADAEYGRIQTVLAGLEEESPKARRLRTGGVAVQLYTSEISSTAKTAEFLEKDQLEHAAQEVIQTYESLRFLRFEMQRAKVDPETVFAPKGSVVGETVAATTKPGAPGAETTEKPEQEVTIPWRQNGDYWRPERLRFSAQVEDRCRR